MKSSPPPPSYSVAMEQQQQQNTQIIPDNIEPPSYQETNEADDIQPSVSQQTEIQQQNVTPINNQRDA